MTSRRSRPSKVLVVDDSEICCEFVRGVLEDAGYTVLTLLSHFGFVKVLRDERPDLVLLDVTMPATSGPKLVELARKKRLDSCPIMLHSDRDEIELARLVSACGADGYIRKTADPAVFLERVSRSIAARARA
jgi:DNA-binding response OmpR family regulator